jgi:hypothetical protein
MPGEMESELEEVVRILTENRWPWRLHATYDETISRALNVFERVNRDIPLAGLNWFFDHAETISDRPIDRVAALGGGIAVQHRMAYQGEYFVERYGRGAAEATPPITKMLQKGIRVSAGTDATRVASYNPWVSSACCGANSYPYRSRMLLCYGIHARSPTCRAPARLCGPCSEVLRWQRQRSPRAPELARVEAAIVRHAGRSSRQMRWKPVSPASNLHDVNLAK